MEEDKKQESTQPESGQPDDPQQGSSLEASPDATGEQPSENMTPGGLSDSPGESKTPEEPPKPPAGVKKLYRRFNLYLLLFILLLVIAAVVVVLTYMQSKKPPKTPNIISQNLSQDELKQIASSNATIGDQGQTLTVQGNAVINGNELVRKNLSVAGNLKLGGNITVQNLTASGSVNLGDTQAKSLQIANSTVLKGDATLQSSLNVAGPSSFNGPITAKKITVTNLVMSGNAQLSVPNHIKFPGPTPARTSIGHDALGSGGTAQVEGSDSAGTIKVNTGGNTKPGCFISIKFSKPFTDTPHVVMTPIDAGAGPVQYYVTRDKTSMSLCTANAAPTYKRFAFDYFITD